MMLREGVPQQGRRRRERRRQRDHRHVRLDDQEDKTRRR